uniref:ZAD domain-containing protein n=1 Tax=Anopheles atroparvus TaxID=41427 RepID=A0A182J0X6_ANOAO
MSYPSIPICRICLSNDELQVSLYSGYAQRRALLTKIRVCLPIRITPGDTLPVTICSQCIERLDQYYDYYCKSETSQRILTEGEGNMDARYHRSSRQSTFDRNTPSASNTGQITTSALPDVIDASKTMNEEMDKMLSQSPQVEKTAIVDEILGNGAVSPASTLSFLNIGQKSKHKKKQKTSMFKDYIHF